MLKYALLAAFCATVCAAGDIKIVKTWDELAAVEPIDIGKLSVRLGIEATSCPSGSAVLIYCMTDGTALSRISGFEQLGPLHVTVGKTKTKILPAPDLANILKTKFPEMDKDSRILFVKGIAIAAAGDHEVSVTKSNGDAIAKVIIKGTTDAGHPWQPWSLSRLTPAEREKRGDFEFVANPSTGMAIPVWNSVQPFIYSGMDNYKPVKRAAGEALPTCVPREVDKSFELRIEGQMLSIMYEYSIIRDAPARMLTRWWINGKPYIPLHRDVPAVAPSRKIRNDQTFQIDMAFDPVRIGAKAGDKIEVQVMYCENGWASVEGPQVPKIMALRAPKTAWPVVMSNRVEFTVK